VTNPRRQNVSVIELKLLGEDSKTLPNLEELYRSFQTFPPATQSANNGLTLTSVLI